jgi:hypothetical protein
MKPSSLAPVLLAATLFLVPALHADEPAADNMGESVESSKASASRQAELLKRFDKNSDGKLDEDEKAAAKEYNREQQNERMNKAGERLRKNAVAKYDKNGDGKLDDAERAEIANDPAVIKRFDKNGDGKLDETEKEAAREAFLKRLENRAGKKKND